MSSETRRLHAEALARALQPIASGGKRYEVQPIHTAPKDGSLISVRVSARWKPYSPKSQQYRSGQLGRWQVMGDYDFENMRDEPEEWLAPVH